VNENKEYNEGKGKKEKRKKKKSEVSSNVKAVSFF